MQEVSVRELAMVLKDIKDTNSDQQVCFIIGAGASRSSGIPTGAELAKTWYDDLKNILRKSEFEAWKRAIGINEDDIGASYSSIYERRFKANPKNGYTAINQVMLDKKPGYGYSVLAQILCQKWYNVVVTTNFDNLIEVALYTMTSTQPMVCGHELLANYATASENRPLIAKIHRDRQFNPQSRPDEINQLHDEWKKALKDLFKERVVIVIGYGGNDGSLMDFLECEAQFSNLFWCIHGDWISERVKKILNDKQGKCVRIEGFDQLMLNFQDSLDINFLSSSFVANAEENAKVYDEAIEKLMSNEAQSNDLERVKLALSVSKKSGIKQWWIYRLEANIEEDEKKAIENFKEGITKYPQNHNLLIDFASYLDQIENYHEAKKVMLSAIEMNKNNARMYLTLANLLSSKLMELDESESYYKRAMELERGNVDVNISYGFFLANYRNDIQNGHNYVRGAYSSDESNLFVVYMYVTYLMRYDRENPEIHRIVKFVTTQSPNSFFVLLLNALYAILILNDDVQGEKYLYRVSSDSKRGRIYKPIYARFIDSRFDKLIEAEAVFNELQYEIKSDLFIAEQFILYLIKRKRYLEGFKVFESMSDECKRRSRFWGLLAIYSYICKRKDLNIRMYFEKSISLYMYNSNVLVNFSAFLFENKDYENAKQILLRAFNCCRSNIVLMEIWIYRAIYCLDDYPNAFEKLEELKMKKAKSDWDFSAHLTWAKENNHEKYDDLQEYCNLCTGADVDSNELLIETLI